GKPHFAHDGLSHRILSVAFSPEGKLAAAGDDGFIRVWDKPTAGEPHRFRGDTQVVFALAFRRDGRLASAGLHGRVRLWKADGGQETFTLPVPLKTECVALSPDGRLIAYGGPFGDGDEVRLWSLSDRAHRKPLRGHAGGARRLAFSPAGDRLFTAAADGTLRVFDLRPPRPPLVFREKICDVTAVAFCPKGVRVATAGADGTIRIWDARTGTPERELHGHTNGVLAVAFGPDGARLASGGSDKTVRVWEVTAGSGSVLHNYQGAVKAVAFSPDGKQLAFGGIDKSVRVWDLARGEEIWKLEGS